MNDAPANLRNVRVRMLRPGVAEQGVAPRPAGHEERLAEHERRIHDHPCECGSGKRYADCCIDRINQEQLELRHRRRMAAKCRQTQGASA
jgi:hypothetical protein